jgi:hypothetical protein
MTAKFIRDLDGFTGKVKLYDVNPPVEYHKAGEYDKPLYTWFVVVSAVIAPYTGAETYIFPADAEGQVIDWGELNGSYRGGLSHETALKNAGYEVTS